MVQLKALYLVLAVVACLALLGAAEPWGRRGGSYVIRRSRPAVRTISFNRGHSSYGGGGARAIIYRRGDSHESYGDDNSYERFW